MNSRFLNSRARNLTQGAIRAMFDRAAKMENVVSMGIGEPDMATPAEICRAGMEALRGGMTHYAPNAGLPGLRRAIAERYEADGLCWDPADGIIVTNGGMGALSTLMLVILEAGDEVIVQDPQWLNYAAQIELCGGTPVRVPVCAADNFEMQADALRAAVTARTKAIIVNSPNNPTGAVISPEGLNTVAAVAREFDLLVISDEVYNTLLYDGARAPSIARLDGMRERTVVINSFSKAFAMTGWRIGYAAGPEAIIDKMVKAQENLNACANAPGQAAAEYALRHPELSARLTEVFAARRERLLAGLSQIGGMELCRPQGAFYAFPDIRRFGLTSAAFCDRLLNEERVVCIPGSAFGACGEGHIRISYTCGEDSLCEALRRIALFCQRL